MPSTSGNNSSPTSSGTGAGLDWTSTYDRCVKQLSTNERQYFLSTDRFEDVQKSFVLLHGMYYSSSSMKCLAKVEPFLEAIRSFSTIIDVFCNAKPEVLSLLWGSVRVLLELTLRVTGALEEITNGLDEIGKALPRLELYKRLFAGNRRIEASAAALYELVFDFCLITIKFYRRSPVGNIFRSVWNNHEKKLRSSILRIRIQTAIIDSESHAANMQLDQSRHEEIRLLLQNTTHQVVVKLPYYTLPYPQNSLFFGRREVLDACQKALDPPVGAQSLRLYTLHGVGGVGKTTIALQYSYISKPLYDVIIWLPADSTVKLNQKVGETVVAMGLQSQSLDPTADRECLHRWLGQTPSQWLLVLDNVDEFGVIKDFWPNAGHGSVLVTSRSPELQFSITNSGQMVQCFNSNEGGRFLMTMLPGVCDTQLEEAEEVSRQLGGLALGIKQMGSFMRESSCTMRGFLDLMQNRQQQGLLFEDDLEFIALDYDHNLATAWEISMSRLSSTASELLGFLSFMDPDTIPESLINDLASNCVEKASSPFKHCQTLKLHRATRLLIRYGLISQDALSRNFAVHRIIQAVVLHRMSIELKQQMAATVIEILWLGHPKTKKTSDTHFNNWHKCSQYAPHVGSLVKILSDWNMIGVPAQKLFDLLFESSWFLLEKGNMARSVELARLAERSCDLTTKEGRVDMSYLCNTYGVVAYQHNDYAKALEWYEKTLKLRQENLGPQDENIGHIWMNICFALADMKRYDEAMMQLEASEDFIAQIPNATPRLRSGIVYHKASTLKALGRLDEAEEAFSRSRRIQLEDPDFSMHSQLGAYFYNDDGNIKVRKSDLEGALKAHSLALRTRKDLLGDHIQTAASFYKVGDILARLGKPEDSSDLLKEACRIYGSLKLGDGYGKGGRGRSAFRLASVLRQGGKFEEAIAWEEEGKQIYRDMTGEQGELPDLPQTSFDSIVNAEDLY